MSIVSGSSREYGLSSRPCQRPPNATSKPRSGNAPGSAISASSQRTRSSTISVRDRAQSIGAPPRPRAAIVVELGVGDLSETLLELVARLAEEVVRGVLGEEALEDRVDRRAARERAELDDRLRILDRLDPKQPAQEEAVRACRVRLEDARPERRALGEPGLDRGDRLAVGEHAVERGQRSLAPASPTKRLGAERRRRDPVEDRRSESLVVLENGDVALGERERSRRVVRSDPAGARGGGTAPGRGSRSARR